MTNPYDTPQAEVVMPAPQGRPALVWVIFLYFCFSVLGGAVSVYFASQGSLPMPAPQREYFASLGVFDWLLSGLGLCLSLAAAIQLFRLKKSALVLWSALLVYGLLSLVYQLTLTSWWHAVGIPGLTGYCIGLAVQAAIVGYSVRLRSRGVLK